MCFCDYQGADRSRRQRISGLWTVHALKRSQYCEENMAEAPDPGIVCSEVR